MPPRNSLRDEDQPQNTIRGETLTNSRSENVARFVGPGGTVMEFDLGMTDSRPDSDGTYVDRRETNIHVDHGGNALPEDGRLDGLSHTGLFIPYPNNKGTCTSLLHPPGRPRIFYDGQDGQRLDETRGRCSFCLLTLATVYTVLGILGVGVVIGLFKGTGVF